MFAPRYFPGSYFPRRYFPAGGSIVVVPPEPTPETGTFRGREKPFVEFFPSVTGAIDASFPMLEARVEGVLTPAAVKGRAWGVSAPIGAQVIGTLRPLLIKGSVFAQLAEDFEARATIDPKQSRIVKKHRED